jgi:hypothetical protein
MGVAECLPGRESSERERVSVGHGELCKRLWDREEAVGR